MPFKQIAEPFHYEKVLSPEDVKKPSGKQKAKAKDMKSTIKRIWDILMAEKKAFYLVILLVVASSALSLAGPVLIGHVVDGYIVEMRADGLLTVLVWLGFIYIGYSFSLWLQNYLMIGISQKTVSYMRTELFAHFHSLPLSFFDRRQYGELMSRVTNDIENVSSTLNSSFIQILSSTLTILGTVAVMFWLSPALAVITFCTVPLMYYGMRWITRRTGKLFRLQQISLGDVNGTIEESISGQRIVKAFSQEDSVAETFRRKTEELKVNGYWAQVYSGNIPKLMNLLNNFNYAVIAGAGGYFAYKGWISIGAIVIFLEFSRQFTRPLNDLANQFNTMLSAIAGAERVFEIMDTDEEASDERGKRMIGEVGGKVTFDSVSFSYDAEGENIIKDFSCEVNPGETLALVGPTGAGKTTVINLLSRFYEYTDGVIRLDGKDIRNYTRASVRSHMSFVLQESFLFQASIMENIRYGRLDATDEEVIKAAREANAHSFIERMPEGYATILKNEGSDLSQGQRQLIAIARAILADASILIMDEATSSIDTITELQIQQALKRLMKGRTCFVIAHRLNTVRDADQIIVLRDGRNIEQGTHEELIGRRGYYADLVHGGLAEDE